MPYRIDPDNARDCRCHGETVPNVYHGRPYLIVLGCVFAAASGAMVGLTLTAWAIREFSR